MAGSNRRDRQLAREKYLRQQARRAQQRARRHRQQQIFASAVAVVAVLAVVGAIAWALVPGSGGKSTNAGAAAANPSASASASVSAAAKPAVAVPVKGCTMASAAPKAKAPSYPSPAVTTARATYTMTMQTNCGTITLDLFGAQAPQTVNSFAFLASKGYFNGTACHRLTTSGIFVLQCGDPTGTGSGGPGYTLPDENLPTKAKGPRYPAGTVAMANTGQQHTGGSQFFIVYKDTDLPATYTVFGKVSSGLDIIQRIAGAGDDESMSAGGGKPRQPVVLHTVTVTKTGS